MKKVYYEKSDDLVWEITKDCERDYPNKVKEGSYEEPSGLRV